MARTMDRLTDGSTAQEAQSNPRLRKLLWPQGEPRWPARPERDDPHDEPDDVAVLTEQERAVSALLLNGHSNKSIASYLDIALRTVEKRRADIAAKLGIQSHLIVLWAALNAEWLSIPEPATQARERTTRPIRQVWRDPTPEEIAERAAEVRQSWIGGEPCYA